MATQTPNGTEPDVDAGPDMSPEERKLWSASHNLPRRYMLVTMAEMKVMADSMQKMRELAAALSRTHRGIELSLSDYQRTEPDVVNAAAAAAFDAQRYKQAVNAALPELRRIHSCFVERRETAASAELWAITGDLVGVIQALNKATELRRNRNPKS